MKMLQMDGGGEYKPIAQICRSLGIQTRLSCLYTSAHNGKVERKHRHMIETDLTLLAEAFMPLKF